MKPYEIALGEYGVKQYEGTKHNPRVLKYFKEIRQSWVKDDETAWCAAFVNWCLKKGNVAYTSKLNARSFLEYGQETKAPELGDIVVLWRGTKNGALGHVGFYVNSEPGFVRLLGGNQLGQVRVSTYPVDRVLGYRKVRI